jgi:hypothetical protein
LNPRHRFTSHALDPVLSAVVDSSRRFHEPPHNMPRYFKNDAPLASRGISHLSDFMLPAAMLTVSSQIHTSSSKLL